MVTPKAITRGGAAFSNQIEELKKLIEESRDSVVNALRKDLKQLETSMILRIEAIESSFNTLRSDCCRLSDEVALLKANVKENETSLVEACSRETQNRLERMNNIMIHGVTEKSDGSLQERIDWDRSQILKVMDELGAPGVEIGYCRRIGKARANGPRLLKVRVNDVAKKRDILQRARTLRNSVHFRNVFMHADLTPMQQEVDKKLRDELKSRRELGEDVVIYRNAVVLRTSIQNFR